MFHQWPKNTETAAIEGKRAFHSGNNMAVQMATEGSSFALLFFLPSVERQKPGASKEVARSQKPEGPARGDAENGKSKTRRDVMGWGKWDVPPLDFSATAASEELHP